MSTTYSRVNKPLPRIQATEGYAFGQLTGQTTKATVGDGSGNVFVSANNSNRNYGRVWIRVNQGVDANGEAITSPPIKALANKDFYPADGMPVNVSVDPVTGAYRIEGNDVLAAGRGGINTNGFNTQNPAHNSKHFADLRDMRSFVPTTNTTSTTKITIEPYLYIYNGTVKLAEKGLSDNVDLSSYVPTAGNERLVGIAIKASDNSVQIVSGTTRTISSDPFAIADLQELADLLDTDAMPVDIWRLKNAQSEINIADRFMDWRQIVNVPGGAGGSGYPDPVTITFEVIAGYTVLVKDSISVTTGAIKLNAGSTLKVF